LKLIFSSTKLSLNVSKTLLREPTFSSSARLASTQVESIQFLQDPGRDLLGQ